MPLTLLDFILVGIMLISGLLALMRGFTREVLSLVAWGVAAVAAYFAVKQQKLDRLRDAEPALSRQGDLAQIARWRRRLHHRADHRLDHQRQDLRLCGRFGGRRLRPHAGLRLRRGARLRASWPSPISSMAGSCPSTSRSPGCGTAMSPADHQVDRRSAAGADAAGDRRHAVEHRTSEESGPATDDDADKPIRPKAATRTTRTRGSKT